MKRGLRAIAAAFALSLGVVAPASAGPGPRLEQLDEASRKVVRVNDLLGQRRYEEALAVGAEALSVREKLVGPVSWEVTDVLHRVARVHLARGSFRGAEAALLRAVGIAEQLLPTTGPSPFFPLFAELAELHVRMGQYARAEADYAREIALREEDHQGSVFLWVTRRGLARLYVAEGRYAEAEKLFQEAASYYAEYDSAPYRSVYAECLVGLASVLRVRGEYPRAEQLLQQAALATTRFDLPDRRTLAAAHEELGRLYVMKRDLRSAEPQLAEVLAIRSETLGPRHPDRARVLARLGALHRLAGDEKRAAAELREALSIQEEALDPAHPDRAETQHELGLLALAARDPGAAEALLQAALAAREKSLGAKHVLVADTLAALAELHLRRRDRAGAEPLLVRALAVREAALGADHPEVATALGDLATLLLRTGKTAQALALVTRALEIQDRRAPMILAMGTEEQKLSYLRSTRREADLALSIHAADPANAAAAELSLSTIFRRKGRVLDAMADSFAALRSRSDPVDRKLLDELAQVDGKLSELLLRGPRWSSITRNQEEISGLTLERRQIEAEVSKRAGELRDRSGFVTLARIKARIPEGAALVELTIHRPFTPEVDEGDGFGAPRVAAFVLAHEGPVQRVDLGELQALDALVAALRPALASPSRDPRPPARALDAAVMAKIRPLLGEKRWILLSPDGALNLVPFGALVDEQGRYLLERSAFTYLTSGSDLLQLETRRASREAPLVLASPAFGELPGRSRPRPAGREAASEEAGLDPSKIRFPPLAETAVEGKLIQYFFHGTRVLIGAEATEAALKKVHGPQVLHLATHGFFLPAPSLDASTGANALSDPGLRSGLAFAGANDRESEGGEDGILTARELATGVDLGGTKLVVLSACETGLGEVHEGDGVHGLRRALVIAGSETQVMSLWRVDDLSTRNLMVNYYRRLVAGGGRSESLRQVALGMLAEPRTAHPYYWASFIVSGNGAALDGSAVSPSFARVTPGPRGCACSLAGEGEGPGASWSALLLALVVARRILARHRVDDRR